MVTDRVTILPDAGIELPAVFAEVAAVCVASSAEAVGGSTWTAVVLVNMVNIQTDNFGDDRFSPVVGCCADMAYRERPEFLGNDSDSSEV